MQGTQILQPVVVLAAWTMVMWCWMYVTRIPAMRAARVDLRRLVRDADATLDRLIPVEVQWVAHNYNHLHEAPTVFYAVALALALLGQGDGVGLWLAWAYVALRIAHSLVQATINDVMTRFSLFALSSLLLVGLIVRALLVVF